MRKGPWMVVFAIAAVLSLGVVACGGDDSSSSSKSGEVKAPKGPKALAKLGKGEGKVNLIAWAGYVEDGSTDPKVDWVSDFEKQTGCQVSRQGRQHLRRDGHADAHGPVRRRVGLG